MATKSTKTQQSKKGWTIMRSDSKLSLGTYNTQKEAIRAAEQIVRQENTNVIIFEKTSATSRGLETTTKKAASRRSTIKHKTTDRLSPKERAKKWREWAAGHSHKSPLLSDEAISRKTIYEDRG